ncbi:MAG: cysteinyl-tRNA synthetase [Bacteriovoracaceae bacterium]|jgi:cysteinyl-tRNA synthetase
MTIFLVGCSTAQRPWPKVKRWGYQLQNYQGKTDLSRIQGSEESLWVIDYSRDGSEEKKFRSYDIAPLKTNKNIILSYISIGEAEDYRYYFKQMPRNFILHENKEWKGNYKIKYWDPAWKEILLGEKGYFAKLIEAGFDGAYLDIVDGFHSFEDKKMSSDKMVELITEIGAFTRARNKNFLIVMQNGADILKYTSKKDELFHTVDALAVEDYLFQDELYTENPELFGFIKEFQKESKAILSIEYIEKKKNLELYGKMAVEKGLLPLSGYRPLKGRLIFSDQLYHLARPCD